MESTEKFEPAAVIEALTGWAATTQALLDVMPGASLKDLDDYVRSVLDCPVSATVLCAALNREAPAQPAPSGLASRKRV
jgi:hypothetical protein